MLDLLIRDAMVLDGTGVPAWPGEVGVAAGRIAEVGPRVGGPARRELRAGGRVVCPGFIDMHAHDDFNLGVNPLAPEKTRQGVTALVTGNCGLSPAPLLPETRQAALDAVNTVDSGLDYGWATFGEWLGRLPRLGPHLVPLVGQGTVRCAVLGMDPRAPPWTSWAGWRRWSARRWPPARSGSRPASSARPPATRAWRRSSP